MKKTRFIHLCIFCLLILLAQGCSQGLLRKPGETTNPTLTTAVTVTSTFLPTDTPLPTITPIPTSTMTPVPTTIGGHSGKYLMMAMQDNQRILLLCEKTCPITNAVWKQSKPIYSLDIDWAPDGKKFLLLVKYEGEPDWDVTIISEEGEIIAEYQVDSHYLEWFPDSQGFIFVKQSEEGNRDIFTMNIYGDEVKQITHTAASESTAHFTPDQTKIVFKVDQSMGIVNADGTDWKYLVDYMVDFDISPDSSTISYCTYHAIHLLDVEENRDSIISSNLDWGPIYYWEPQYSKDGKWIIYYVHDCVGNLCDYNKHAGLIVPSDGSSQPRVIATFCDRLNWSPDGEWIVYEGVPNSSQKEYPEGHYIEKPDGSGLRVLTDEEATFFRGIWQPIP